ncbi:MAG: hypothetical protein EOP07_07465 [Proteobacteria bacterium]|nr:MAG: hypothetical protein EOP07_07465 [Pseudomonadota bacterium]
MLRTHPILTFSAVFLSIALSTGCTKDADKEELNGLEEAISAPAEKKEVVANTDGPALAVGTVASLISVNKLLVREPERFKKVLCSDNQFYDLSFDGGRYSLPAEPLSVCVLFSDTKNLKPLGICGDDRCEASSVSECGEAEKVELIKTFAEEQKVQRCWNIGSFSNVTFTVLMTKIGQSCQAQTLAKTPKGWIQLSTIDGTFEARKTATAEGTGCWWEAGATYSFEGDWFGQEKRVLPIMAFQKDNGLYALLRSTWSGTENYQLFRIDGEKAVEVESFAESFKEPTPDSMMSAPIPTSAPEAAPGKGKQAAPDIGTPPADEGVSPVDSAPVPEAAPELEAPLPPPPDVESAKPSEAAPAASEEGVSPLDEQP